MFAALTLSACSTDDPYEDIFSYSQYDNSQSGGMSGTGGSTSTNTGVLGDLASFDISVDTSSLSESETLPDATDTYYEDYVETYSPTSVVTVTYDGSQATIGELPEGVTATVNGAHVTISSTLKNMCYQLSGSSTDGSFKIYSDKKFSLVMNGITLTNPQGAAINNQGKRMYLVIADGTINSLSDGTTYSTPDDEDEKGALFSEGKIAISGSGLLTVTAQGKNGIVSDDYILFRPGCNVQVKSTASNGIKSNDGIIIRGGVINVETSANASKAMKTDGQVLIEGGRTTLLTTGSTEYDSDDREYKGCAALKADSIITITGGTLLAKSTGGGGKGISGDLTMTITGGTVRALSTGSNSNSVSAKAIKFDGDILIQGGDIMARASSHEAIETKGKLTVEAGSVAAYSSDDAINSAKDMNINGGYVYGYSTGNDGIDSNGNLTVSGGLLIGIGATAPEEGIDAVEGKTFSINGGTVIGLGGGGEAMSGTQQKASISGVSVSAGSYLAVLDANGSCLFALQSPRGFSGATLQVSDPNMKSGTTYTLSSASSISGTGSFFGYLSAPTVSSATQITTFTTSTTTSGGMGGAGGGFPGSTGTGGSRPGGW